MMITNLLIRQQKGIRSIIIMTWTSLHLHTHIVIINWIINARTDFLLLSSLRLDTHIWVIETRKEIIITSSKGKLYDNRHHVVTWLLEAGRRLSSRLIHPRSQWHLPLRVKLIIENDGSGDQSHYEKVMKHEYFDSNDEEKKNPTCAELSWTHSAFDASGSVRFILCVCNAMDSFFLFK
jgi:hypothetical protein